MKIGYANTPALSRSPIASRSVGSTSAALAEATAAPKPPAEDSVDKSRAIVFPYAKADMIFGVRPSILRGAARLTSISGIVDTSLGVAGIVGGAWGIKSGIDYLKQGKKTEAAAEFIGGAAGVAESALAFFGGGPHLPLLGAVAAFSDGYKDVYVGLRQNLPERNQIGAAKILSGTLMMAGGISANPWITGVGALTYTAAVTYDNRNEIKELSQKTGQWFQSHWPLSA